MEEVNLEALIFKILLEDELGKGTLCNIRPVQTVHTIRPQDSRLTPMDYPVLQDRFSEGFYRAA